MHPSHAEIIFHARGEPGSRLSSLVQFDSLIVYSLIDHFFKATNIKWVVLPPDKLEYLHFVQIVLIDLVHCRNIRPGKLLLLLNSVYCRRRQYSDFRHS